jgi:DNA-directed RNA polymerase subunit H (RpoH/RPB5)
MTGKKDKHFNIMKHELVPLHIFLSDKEKEQLLKKYNITTGELPKILDTDPVAFSIGAKPGQLVKIIRQSDTAKEAVSYRFVVKSDK